MRIFVRYCLPMLIAMVGYPNPGMTENAIGNQSGLVFKKNTVTGAAADYHPSHLCWGTLTQDAGLSKIKLSLDLLKKGVECVAGDFDGNGFLDFALFQPHSPTEFYPAAQVIFFDGPRIKKVSTLSNPPTQLWSSGTEGICFQSGNKMDALYQSGGGELDRTATFNPKTGEWERDECGGEGGTE